MLDTDQVRREVDRIANLIEDISEPLARSIDTKLFAGEPPKVVTLEAIDAKARLTPQREEVIQSIRYFDGVLLSSGILDGEEVGSLDLLRGIASMIRRAAASLPTESGDEVALNAEAARSASRSLAFQLVSAAWLMREQLLVVDLALALGIDPIPSPSDLQGGGDA